QRGPEVAGERGAELRLVLQHELGRELAAAEAARHLAETGGDEVEHRGGGERLEVGEAGVAAPDQQRRRFRFSLRKGRVGREPVRLVAGRAALQNCSEALDT